MPVRPGRGELEYFVSGTRFATRAALYRADLTKVPGCAKATHFVYGYNVGAYEVTTRGVASAAGSERKSSSKIAQKMGDLSACRATSPREIDACRVPVRLTLREVTEGTRPN